MLIADASFSEVVHPVKENWERENWFSSTIFANSLLRKRTRNLQSLKFKFTFSKYEDREIYSSISYDIKRNTNALTTAIPVVLMILFHSRIILIHAWARVPRNSDNYSLHEERTRANINAFVTGGNEYAKIWWRTWRPRYFVTK